MMTPSLPATHPAAADVLRGAGLRVTESRTAVFESLAARPHASADAVFADIEQKLPRTSRQSVYNALSDFTAAGLVRRIEPAGQPMRFELRVDDNHHHLICTGCGAVEDIDCAVGHAPCLTPATTHGYAISTAEVTYWGLCPSCAAEAA
ncbi:Fur family ferric uptake transcriptional regulator [Microbacterium invictum]|uniref:Fur family ferric uptake transcriptional regulator n=1 Tax=Microbacterium invictum TaxID=515415 RepID=A0AA40SP12_9MICO|nr:Fur family ferric uptake transcriptional regulator [Microbacterium invictum]